MCIISTDTTNSEQLIKAKQHNQNIMRYYLPVFALMLLLSLFGHYSTFSFVFALLVYVTRSYVYYPFVISNSISIICTWYTTMAFLDKTLMQRMITKNNWSLSKYIVGDFVLHVVPAYISLKSLFDNNLYENLVIYQNVDIVRLSGFYSCMSNMLWALTSQGTFQVNNAYVQQSSMIWMYIWMVSTIYHIIPMLVFNYKFEDVRLVTAKKLPFNTNVLSKQSIS